MQIERRHSKREILGQLRVDYLFGADELPGVSSSSTRWDVLAAFLRVAEGCAERLIEIQGGLIFLQSIPGRPNTGAIYAYNEARRAFVWLRFDRDDDLNGRDFDRVVWAYRLARHDRVLWQTHPAELSASVRLQPGSRVVH
jgi:hypothetical protein